MARDLLLQLGANPQTRKLVQSLGLPIPMPQALDRAPGPYEARPLEDASVLVGGALRGELGRALARSLVEAGAEPIVAGSEDAFTAPGEAWGRPPRPAAELEETERVDALVFDATEVSSPAGLRALYDFFHPHVRRLRPSGRGVLIGRPPLDAPDAAGAAARHALDGFVRSVAKEVGRRGSTAQLLVVEAGAEARLDPVLRFVLGRRSAFVTGQPIPITRTVAGTPGWPRVRPLEGKVCLVTGAARGIGAATVGILAGEGAKVVCLDRPDDDGPLSAVAREHGGVVLAQDVTAPEAPEAIADALEALGGVDVVVHNAGVTRDKTLAKMSESQWDLAVDVNLGAVARITEALVQRKVLREGGRIVCLSSVAGIAGNVGQTNYAASKAGVVGFVRRLAPELADRGVTVNAIAPGFIETRLTDAMPTMIREVARRLSALGQGGRPEDVGQAIAFLSTPGAVGVTGHLLRVCGGALVGA